MTVYTLKKKGDTKELHLFRATPVPGNKCTPERQSICKKMDSSESSGNKFACYDEDSARKECAEIGRAVCGICVSHLYESY